MARSAKIDAKLSKSSAPRVATLISKKSSAGHMIAAENIAWPEYRGQPLLFAFDDLWRIEIEKLFDPVCHARIWRVHRHLDSGSASRWPKIRKRLSNISHRIPAISPTQAAMALGPRWWVSINARNLWLF